MTKPTLPEFASVQEAAEFWDTHDAADYEHEFLPVDIEIAKELGHVLRISLNREEFYRLSALARSRDVNMVKLAQSWVLEALERAERDAPADATKRSSAD